MIKRIIIIIMFCLPTITFGSEFEFSLGTGFQYSGVLGTQFAVKHEESKYFLSVGLPGYSLGMQTIVSDNEYHFVGFSLGEIRWWTDSQYGFATYNYHMDGFKNNGWVFGVGIGMYDEKEHTPLFGNESVDPSSKAMFTLDIGYKF